MFLAYVSEGAYERDAIAELLLILVVMPLHHGFTHILPQTLIQLLGRHHVVQYHVWEQRDLHFCRRSLCSC